MRATISTQRISPPYSNNNWNDQPDSIQKLLKPLSDLAGDSDFLIGGAAGEFTVGRNVFQIPRFIFMGPAGGGDTIRLGIFAAIHGDEPEGAEALVKWLQELETTPQATRGYHIYAYPVCNPSGFVAQTHHNANGKSLSRQFWNKSSQPEAYYLEREMGVLRFQGVISLHVESHSNRFIINTVSPVLKQTLAQPAIKAIQLFLPRDLPKVDSSPASASALPPNFLTNTDELKPAPFELHIGIPRQLPKPSQIYGTMSALKSILDSYRSLVSLGQNI